MSTQKYKELYDLSIVVLKQEHDRYEKIEEKASRYLSALTVLFGLSTLLLKMATENVGQGGPTGTDTLLLAVSILFLASLAVSWIYVFKVFRIGKTLKIPLDRPILDFFEHNRLIDVYYAMADRNRESWEANVRTTNLRARNLHVAYGWMRASTGLLVLLATVLGFRTIDRHWIAQTPFLESHVEEERAEQASKDSNSHDDNNGSAKTKVSDDTPDKRIKAPKHIALSEGYEPRESEDEASRDKGSEPKE